ncbi:hypothetical protein FHU10_1228 [Serratia fonticola]|uniref:Uncharacterized protein n=1 Tax=Serratia fonticola TaxID=47917 RepID=A0A542BJH3_SERFO|nr:hypothetical protein [Serratia fonticola]TQI78731.1 hypothetical protein FHU09_1223 [Serratia fonticola]TQI99247.1 hypothetical protein FHU11_4829 [Serratia fonticola]TVZ68772.1 hypothetical protein FHU10_1228 [Serratia fonticola]
MSTVKVDITAISRVRYSKVVDMEKEDYERYLAICDSETNCRESDKKLTEIAVKYGFEPCDDQIEDIDDPEDIEFDLID